jgi:hypothetical protein
MSRQLLRGPSATAQWTRRDAGTADRSLPILVLPDAANAEHENAALPDSFYALPAVPQLVRDRADSPVFSLSLMLGRRPAADEDSIFSLIESAALACDVSIAVPDYVTRADSLLPLFARQVVFRLVTRDGTGDVATESVLVEAIAQGTGARAGLAAIVDRTEAQAMLGALQQRESNLTLACRVTYRTAESRVTVHLAARWANVYDFLKARAGGSFTETALRGHLLEMARTGVISAHRVEPSGLDVEAPETDPSALWNAFSKVRSMLLDTAGSVYTLRDRPDIALTIDSRLAVTTSNEAHVDLDAPLEAVIGGALDGLDAERFITLSYADAGTRGRPQPVPRRVSGSGTRGAEGATRGAAPIYAPAGGHVVSLARALTTDTTLRPFAHALLASDEVRLHTGPAHMFAVNNVVLGRVDGGAAPEPNLPVVDDPGGALWADHADSSRFWYAPEFKIAPVDPAADPDASTFQFTFREAGHDDRGRPVLEGEALFTVLRGISAATQAALVARGSPRADAVPIGGLSASLQLPVKDTSGQLRQIDLSGTVADKGSAIEVRVALMNDYLRVAYGDLAIANFQPNAAQLTLAYTFEAIVPAPDPNPRLQYVGKILMTPVAYTAMHANALRDVPFVDASRVAYRSPAADLVYQREAPLGTREVAAVGAARRFMGAAAVQPVAPFRPHMESAIRLQEYLREKRYARQTQGQSVLIPAFFPCNTLGAYYRQDLGDRKVSIGCQDSFSLGQTAFKLYEAIDDTSFANTRYKVYRSLSQPGHFLVQPTAYRIARYAPTEGDRAYRPAVYLYSSLDAEHEANNRCVVMASLEPDLPPWVRRELGSKLTTLHHNPVVQYLTEIDADVAYTWSLDGGVTAIDPHAAKLWNGFQATLSSDLAGGLQLQGMLRTSGVTANARFTLQDGTTLNTSLILDLSGLTGPWAGGPIATVLQASQATLTNGIELGVNVSDLIVYAASGASQSVRVDRLIEPGGFVLIDLPIAVADAYPVYAVQPGNPAQLSEASSFVEDIRTNVVFVSLVNYANHDLKRLDLNARLKEAPGSDTAVPVSEADPVGEADFVLPLTTYLGPRTLQFQVTKTDAASRVTTTPWLEWDLASQGNVVSLTWDLIGGDV